MTPFHTCPHPKTNEISRIAKFLFVWPPLTSIRVKLTSEIINSAQENKIETIKIRKNLVSTDVEEERTCK